MSSDPRLVPMDLFLQDQKRQDDDIKGSRIALERAVERIVKELQGLRADTVHGQSKLKDELESVAGNMRVDKAIEAVQQKQILSRREKLFAVFLIAIPLVASAAQAVIR